MWILIQLILCPMAISLLSTSIWTGVNYNSDGDAEEIDHYTYTMAELNKIESFRMILKDVQLKEYEKSNDFLIRWLREANMDLKSANRSLRHALKWREDNQMDTILNKTFPIKNLPRPCIIEGVDKRGGPVISYKFKAFDVRNILANGYIENTVSQLNQCLESYFQNSITGGPKSEQIRITPGIAIVDAEGSSMKQHGCLTCVDLYRQVLTNAVQFYPRMKRLIVLINAPPYARRVVETLKPFFSSYSVSTLRIFGNDRAEWTQFLLSVIPKDQLPVEYGGAKETLIS